jgi:hypothetical protein
MCAKCDELDHKIAYYQLLLLAADDKPMANGLADKIARHEAAKRALHREAPPR